MALVTAMVRIMLASKMMRPISSVQSNRALAELLTEEFRGLYVQWGHNQPPRTGLHVSSLLVSEDEWCVRQHVLGEIAPEHSRVANHTWKTHATFLNGWRIHERWQHDLFKPSGLVVTNGDTYELDLTHYDQDRGVYFSPDAIVEYAGVRYVVEIKGINTLDFQGCRALYDEQGVLVQEARPGIKHATLQEAMKLNKSIRAAVPQANLYMHLLELQKAIILVEDKNTQDFRLWVIDYHREAAWPYTQRADQVKGKLILYKANGSLPARICHSVSDGRAARCPMRTVCFEREG